MRINIVHVGFFYSGGGERVAINQTERLHAVGYEVSLFAPVVRYDKCYPELLRKVRPERITVHWPFSLPFRDALALLASAIFPVKLSSIADCDLLICHSQPSMWIGYLANLVYGTPYIGYLHQLTAFIHPRSIHSTEDWATTPDFKLLDNLIGCRFKILAKTLDYVSHKNAARLLFNSVWTKSLFEKSYGLSGEVCYPAIDVPRRPAETFAIGDHVITASRHCPRKRIDLGFEVLKKLKSKPRLFITGAKTRFTGTLRSLASKAGVSDQTVFTGFVSEDILHGLYSGSKAYISTSVGEPFGLSIIEAESFGVPAMAWKDAGPRETIIDQVTGFHAIPYDVNDYAYKLDNILGDERLRSFMRREARILASSFSWESHVEILVNAIEEAIG